MANTYKGRIEAVEGIQFIQREGKEPFQKRRVMLDVSRYDGLTGEKRERYVIFEFNGKNATIPDGFKKGDYVEVTFDVESHQGTKKDGTSSWFTTVSGYKIEPVALYQKSEQKPSFGTNAPQAVPQQQPTPQQTYQQASNPAPQQNNCPF